MATPTIQQKLYAITHHPKFGKSVRIAEIKDETKATIQANYAFVTHQPLDYRVGSN